MIAAVEDVLSEAVVRKLIAVERPDLVLSGVLRKNGREYVRSRARELNRTAHSIPVLVVVDLDRPVPCPADLIESWLPSPRAPMLLFRLAVMEIEAWVMADRVSFAKFMSVALHRVPANPDAVLQPKELIVSLAKQSKSKDIREDLAPSIGDTRRVGPAFNARLTAYVADSWNPAAAAASSPSLRRATDRLRSS
jgi:hypothetical protein